VSSVSRSLQWVLPGDLAITGGRGGHDHIHERRGSPRRSWCLVGCGAADHGSHRRVSTVLPILTQGVSTPLATAPKAHGRILRPVLLEWGRSRLTAHEAGDTIPPAIRSTSLLLSRGVLCGNHIGVFRQWYEAYLVCDTAATEVRSYEELTDETDAQAYPVPGSQTCGSIC